MQKDTLKIGFGGGCHWCTEAVFQSLKGITHVEQGYIKSTNENSTFSEAVIVTFTPYIISLKDLITIHLHTHHSTSNHSFRKKYRSAIYYFDTMNESNIKVYLEELQQDFDDKIITRILPYNGFSASRKELINYHEQNPEKPFCKKYITPKLEFLKNKYSKKLK
ncbi:peptide-methionine (S)-S-oxide reductase [Aquimarina algicola]|uniref:peptide-methionine (S)-S-oxide reductase n=1 Tax=Aquimarina algicola TaxID=2589995 RepID=A0A504J7H0_9FLAO|nr:peptide-methionine (S)-S-oxide reductase [Aquimarina algicola]TPN84545.1 peptide methionine sulfoxide reductase [Aquimarina algicola]